MHHCGGIAGTVANSSTDNNNMVIKNIQDCVNEGKITSYRNVGGIIGKISKNTNITNCENRNEVIANFGYIGGIVGFANDVITIKNCKNSGNISCISENQYQRVGGIIGSGNVNSSISDSINIGNISGTGNDCGGIVGYYKGTIDKCVNKGNVETTTCTVAGIVASFDGGETSILSNCYNTGDISIADTSTSTYASMGGIVGCLHDNVIVKNAYNIGKIISKNTNWTGGIAGHSTGSISNCFYIEGAWNWGIEGADIENSAVVKTSEEIKGLTNILNQVGTENEHQNWKVDYQNNQINNGYPILVWQ